MILVFFALPIASPVFTSFSIVNSRAADVASEIANEFEWFFTV